MRDFGAKLKNMPWNSLVLVLFALTASTISMAEVTLPSLWMDHMVVQRDLPVHVWGKATAGEKIAIHFRGATAETVADKLGRWDALLQPGGAGGPFTMEVVASNTIHIADILVGDVWLASGQSNMELGTKSAMNAEEETKHAERPNIRLFHVARRSSDFPQEDVETRGWVLCGPETVADFSAVAYFFGREIEKDQHVPIGLIEADWGGTPAETWTSAKALSATAGLMPAWSTWAEVSEKETSARLERTWEDQQRQAAKAAGKPEPKFPWHAELRSELPGGAFNGMIAPLVSFPIRGVIWYQGESNTGIDRAYYYQSLFSTLIGDWRERWGQGDFPFLYVQLANFIAGPENHWPEVREAQRRSLNVSQTGMAVTIDIGDPEQIHPTNKQEVGRRLSLLARSLAYNENLETSGPLYKTKMREGASIRLYFDHVKSGLTLHGDALTGFEIADPQGKYFAAKARVDGETVVVTSSEVQEPTAVRYGWSASPLCNLYNKEGLPASPFTTF